MDNFRSTELQKAFWILKTHGDALLKARTLNKLLKGLSKLHTRNKREFDELGVFEYCKICGQGPKKGCCLREAGNWYDRYQLLINLLLGAKIELNNDIEFCPFLGISGCTLVYRHEFCINFFCEEIKKAIGLKKIQYLRSIAGKEISEGLKIERYILKKLKELCPQEVDI